MTEGHNYTHHTINPIINEVFRTNLFFISRMVITESQHLKPTFPVEPLVWRDFFRVEHPQVSVITGL